MANKMTKKDYVAISAAIMKARNASDSDCNVRRALDSVTDDLAKQFARSNPKFDKVKFWTACGVTP